MVYNNNNPYHKVIRMSLGKRGQVGNTVDWEERTTCPSQPEFGLSAEAAAALVEDLEDVLNCFESLLREMLIYSRDVGWSREMNDRLADYTKSAGACGEFLDEWTEIIYRGEGAIRIRDNLVDKENSFYGFHKDT